MSKIQQPNEGEIKKVDGEQPVVKEEKKEEKVIVQPTNEKKPEQTENPTVKETDAKTIEEQKTTATEEPAKEMTVEQFEQYNETLRRVSKTAKAGLQARYNAFEDAEVKADVKAKILAGEKPDIKSIATSIVTRHAPKEDKQTEKPTNEVVELRAELALLKAGIINERLDAAKKLFIAEGGDPVKAAEFVEKYPEWKKQPQSSGVSFSKAQPVDGKTAPANTNPPVMNDFEKKVYAARKARGLPV